MKGKIGVGRIVGLGEDDGGGLLGGDAAQCLQVPQLQQK